MVRKHCSSVRQLSSPGSADRSELMLCVATIGMQARLARQREGALVAGRVGFADGREGVVLVADEQRGRARSASGCAVIFGMRWRTARWKSSFSITPSAARESRVQADREVQREHRARIRAVPRAAAAGRGSPGFGVLGVDASRRAERAVHRRVVVEQRQEDDDAFGDRGAEPVVEPLPAVREPAVDGLDLVLAFEPGRAVAPCARRYGMPWSRRCDSRSALYWRAMCSGPSVEPVAPARGRQVLQLVVRERHDDHFRRLAQRRLQLARCSASIVPSSRM